MGRPLPLTLLMTFLSRVTFTVMTEGALECKSKQHQTCMNAPMTCMRTVIHVHTQVGAYHKIRH